MSSIDIEQESRLIASAKDDLNEFSALYDLYVDRVYRYFVSRTGSIEFSQDLTSQVFLQALERFDRYEFTGKPLGVWLFRIAHNLLVDWYRKKKNPSVSIDEAFDVSDDSDLESDVHTKLLYCHIENILKEFSSEEKEIILLKIISGLKFSEIAESIGKNENTVKTKYFRALKRLRGKVDTLSVLVMFFSVF